MALDLGEMLGHIGLDVSPLERALGQADASMEGFASDAERRGGDAGSGFSESFKKKAGDVAKVAGAGIGTALAVGVADNLDVTAGRNKLQAQLGLTAGDSKKAGELAGKVYADNYGENLGDVNDAIGAVMKNTNLDLGSVDIQPAVEKILTLRDVFDQDLGDTTAAAGQMVKTGMAKNIGQALDIITVGLQGPANKADDLLDTFNEYGTQFRKVGIGGKEALGLLSQGLQGGARDADLVADSLKEFSIRAVDGSETTAAGFKAIGLNGKHMAEMIAKGGPSAQKGLQMTLDGLRNIHDPAKRSAAAVNLFGTQAEDMGAALYKLDPSTAVKSLGKVKGAADKMTAAVGGGPANTIETYKRKLIEMGRGVIESTGPTAALAGAIGAIAPAALSVLGPVAQIIAARGMQAAAAGTAAAAEEGASAATVTGWLRAAAASTVGAVKMAASWLIAIGPVALVIAAIVGVVILVIKYWDQIKGATKAAWNAVVGFVVGAWGKIKGAVSAAVGAVVGFVKKHWGLLLGIILGPLGVIVTQVIKHWDKIKKVFSNSISAVVGFVKAIPGKIKGALSALGSTLRNLFSKGWDAAKSATSNVVGNIVGFVKGVPGKVRSGLNNVIGFVRNIFHDAMQAGLDKVKGIGGTIVDWIRGIPGKILNLAGSFSRAGKNLLQGFIDGMKNAAGIIKGIAGNVWNAVKGLLNGAIDRINNALEFKISLPGPDININLPDIPHLANGTKFWRGGLTMVGERGPELLELPRGSAVTPNHELGGLGRQAPLIGTVVQAPNQSTDELAEALWFKTRTRG